MKEPILVESTLEVLFFSLTFLSGIVGTVSVIGLLSAFFQYYLTSGDEEKMRQARIAINKGIVGIIFSLIIGAVAFYIGKNNFLLE